MFATARGILSRVLPSRVVILAYIAVVLLAAANEVWMVYIWVYTWLFVVYYEVSFYSNAASLESVYVWYESFPTLAYSSTWIRPANEVLVVFYNTFVSSRDVIRGPYAVKVLLISIY